MVDEIVHHLSSLEYLIYCLGRRKSRITHVDIDCQSSKVKETQH